LGRKRNNIIEKDSPTKQKNKSDAKIEKENRFRRDGKIGDEVETENRNGGV
jgi:hypothetical protein